MVWNGMEKRRFIRANFPCKIVISTPSQHTIVTNTENIGGGGIRVIIDEKLDISSMVGLDIHLDKDLIKSKARIVWVVKVEDSSLDKPPRYDTGIEFYEMNEDDRKIINNFVEAFTG